MLSLSYRHYLFFVISSIIYAQYYTHYILLVYGLIYLLSSDIVYSLQSSTHYTGSVDYYEGN